MVFEPWEGIKRFWDTLPTERRFSASVLGICGILVLVLSAAYFRSHLTSPFLVSKAVLDQAKPYYDKQAATAREEQASRERDTDHDGLSDWSELNIYHTSPYLADTDSDGIPDSIEIAQGTDPNCPQGQQCSQLANQDRSGNATTSYSNLLDVKEIPTATAGSGASSFIATAPDPATVTPAQIRNLLKDNSLVDQAQLSGLTDAEVVRIYTTTYAEVLKIRQAAANQGVTIPASSSTAP